MELYNQFKVLCDIYLAKYPMLINNPMILLDIINAENTCNFPKDFVSLYFEKIYPDNLELV